MVITSKRLRNDLMDFIQHTRQVLPRRITQLQIKKRETSSVASTGALKTTEKPSSELVARLNISSSLQAFIDRAEGFSPYSVILGVCEDNLPLTINLTNPAPGSILITGDQECGKRRLLKAILKSAVLLNNQRRLQIYTITKDVQVFGELWRSDVFKKVIIPESGEARDLVDSLVDVTYERRITSPGDPSIILAIDDLPAFASAHETELIAQLMRLARHGPRSRVWTIATLSAYRFASVHERLLAAFRTRLIGKVASIRLANDLVGVDPSPAINLERGSQFCVPVNDTWVLFSICD